MGFAGRSWWISHQPAPLSQTLSVMLHNADPSFQRLWEEKPQTLCGGNIPVESGRGNTSTWHPASYGSIPAPILAMPRTSGAVQGTIPPLPGRGIGTHSVATPALSLQESDVPGLGQAGHSRGSLRLGAGAVLPRRTSEGRISVFSQLQTALPFPSLAQLRREHQVQRQGHRPPAFPTRLTPAGQGWSGRKASLSWWES